MTLLAVCQGRAIHGLKKHFGVAFRKETNQISTVLVLFNVTFFIRVIFEGYLGYLNSISIPKQNKRPPCQYPLSIEILVNSFMSYLFPIGLICYLHYRNTRPATRDRDRVFSTHSSQLFEEIETGGEREEFPLLSAN